MTEKFDKTGQGTEYSESASADVKPTPGEIKLYINFEIASDGNKIFKSGHASVPLMKINFLSPATDGIYPLKENAIAPSGEYVEGKKDFELKCEYFGERD